MLIGVPKAPKEPKQVWASPRARAILSQKMRERNARMTPEEKSARGRKGAAARYAKRDAARAAAAAAPEIKA